MVGRVLLAQAVGRVDFDGRAEFGVVDAPIVLHAAARARKPAGMMGYGEQLARQILALGPLPNLFRILLVVVVESTLAATEVDVVVAVRRAETRLIAENCGERARRVPLSSCRRRFDCQSSWLMLRLSLWSVAL